MNLLHRKKYFFWISLILVLFFSHSLFAQMPPFANEKLSFKISWMGMTVGYAQSTTRLDEKTGLLKGHTFVSSFDFFKKIYYIGGFFGGYWNYKKRLPHYAYEELFHGVRYEKRDYRFRNNKITVNRLEKRFQERSLPHKKSARTIHDDQRTFYLPGYMDLMSAFYFMRTTGHSPTVGEIQRIPVLPAGKKRILVLQVLKKQEKKFSGFGKKNVFLIKAALADPAKQGKISNDQDMFIKTNSPIYMWVSDDGLFLPLEMYSKVPYLGNVYVRLTKYELP